MNRQPTLVLVSGLGADGRLFEPQRALPWPIVTVKWLEPHRRETLADYAQRLATALTVAEPFFLGGASMGGMVALEMSRWTRPEAVFLIASARSGRVIHPVLRAGGRAVGRLPLAFTRLAGIVLAALAAPRPNELTPDQWRLLRQMADASSRRFYRWGCRAVVAWPGVDLPRTPVYHIHGDRDRLMPLSRVRPDHVVRGGGHMINLTHADEVNTYLREKIERHMNER